MIWESQMRLKSSENRTLWEHFGEVKSEGEYIRFMKIPDPYKGRPPCFETKPI